MDPTLLCFTHVNPQHLHGDYNISDHPLPAAMDDWSQSFLDQAPLNVYPYAQFGHSSLLDTPFVFPAVVSEFSNAAGGSLFLTPSMPTSDLPILENELAQSTSTSVEERISSVSESSLFALHCYSSEHDDISRQFQITDVPDLFIDASEVSSHKQDPDTSDVHLIQINDVTDVPDLFVDVSEVSSHKQDSDTSNVDLIEGITTINKRKLTQQDLPPQKKTKGTPEVTVVKMEQTYKCPTCGKFFGRRLDNLKRHQEQTHLTKQELDAKGKLFKCPREGCRSQQTEYGFKTKQQLDVHMQKSCRFRPGGASSTS